MKHELKNARTTHGKGCRLPDASGEACHTTWALYQKPAGIQTRWSSFENPTAGKGIAAQENCGAKGHPCDVIPDGHAVTLLDVKGSGLVNRIWLTVNDRSPAALRGLVFEAVWDDAKIPAVSVPLGDFFGIGLGRRTPFECALFSDPEGRSFNSLVPMPFRESAKIRLLNESGRQVLLWYDIDFLLGVRHPPDTLYFHASWRRESPNRLGRDFAILPEVRGAGRFLGCNMGIIVSPLYSAAWWGEGEVKFWLDDDREFPTLCGTGLEDYVGSAWGLGAYTNRLQGCSIADKARGQWAMYRLHLDDPVFFDHSCRVCVQTIGGAPKQRVKELLDSGAPLIPVTLSSPDGPVGLKFLEATAPVKPTAPDLPEGWVNFYRQDDWSATAYFYLNTPENGLPVLPPAAERSAGLDGSGWANARADI